MMKAALNKLLKNEKGQALPIVLILLLLGGLFTSSLLGYMGTGLIAGQVYETKMAELYAADAGIEDGLWNLLIGGLAVPPLGQSVLPQFTLNDKTVDVTIDDIGSSTYKIISTAGNTTIEAYVTMVSGYIFGDFDLPPGDEIEDTNVYASGNITLGVNSEVEGENGDLYIWAGGDIILDNNAEVKVEDGGNLYVCAGGDIILGDNAKIEAKDGGDICICAGGDLILGDNAEIKAKGGGDVNVYVAGNIILGDGSKIYGDVYVGGTVDEPSRVTGTINPYQECPCSACLAINEVLTWEIQ